MSAFNEGDKGIATGEALATSTSTNPVPKVSVVSQKRKEELLLIARAERRRWIEKVPLPYCPESFNQQHRQGSDSISSRSSSDVGKNLGNDLWAPSSTSSTTTGSSLYKVKSSLVCQKYLPSATAVISELYGLPTSSSFSASSGSTPSSSSLPAIETGPLGFVQVAERVEGLVSATLLMLQSGGSKDLSDDNLWELFLTMVLLMRIATRFVLCHR